QLERFIEANVEVLKSDLERVRGLVQMTARLASRVGAPAPPDDTSGPGTQFLKGRQAQRTALVNAAEWWTTASGNLIQESETSFAGNRPTLITVAHLVQKSDVANYRARFDEVCLERPDLSCLRSGPWPPYGFVSLGKPKDGPS